MILSLALACATPEPPPAPPTPTPELAPPPAPPEATLTDGVVHLPGATGDLAITPVYHATTMLQLGGKTWWLDPWSKAALDGKPKADVLLITDEHFDHLDAEAIAKVRTDATVIVAPKAVADKLPGVTHVLANGDSVDVAGVKITAVPMYNLVRGPEGGGKFHDKGRGDGFILKADGRRIYFAGDTECTDEMKALTGIDLAFVPMNLPYTMPPDEAAACVAAFAPKAVVPYHYAGSDLAVFATGLAGKATKVIQAEYYPGGLPW